MQKIVDGKIIVLSKVEQDARTAEWENSPPEMPPLKRWQFHAMLDILGKTQAVQDAVELMADPTVKAVAKAKIAHTDSFDRDDPLFSALAPDVGLTEAEIDAAWLIAKDLT